jgi:hypothetical protein
MDFKNKENIANKKVKERLDKKIQIRQTKFVEKRKKERKKERKIEGLLDVSELFFSA